MRLRVNSDALDVAADLAGQRVEQADLLDLGVEQFDAHCLALGIGRVHVDDLAAHAVGAALQLDVVARVLDLGQPPQNTALVDLVADHQVQQHLEVGIRVAEAVDRRHRSDDHRVTALHQRLGRRQPHLLDVLVDRRILLDEGIRGRHVGFRLVIIVVGDEVLHRVAREEFLHLAVELSRQRLVVRHDDRRALQPLDQAGYREGLARAGDPEQRLVHEPVADALHQRIDRLRLVAGGLILGLELELPCHKKIYRED